MPNISANISSYYGIVVTVRKQIEVCDFTRSKRKQTYIIRTDEPANLRVVVPAVQVIQFRLGIEVIALVPERIDHTDVRAAGDRIAAGVSNAGVFAPSVVAVVGYNITRRIRQRGDLTLSVITVVVGGGSAACDVIETDQTGGVIQEERSFAVFLLTKKLS